jgi:hypothetical protein
MNTGIEKRYNPFDPKKIKLNGYYNQARALRGVGLTSEADLARKAGNEFEDKIIMDRFIQSHSLTPGISSN